VKTKNHPDATEFHYHLLKVCQTGELAENIWWRQETKDNIVNEHFAYPYSNVRPNYYVL
jgi:hypothetical protein